MTNSSKTQKPAKPHPDFPLFPHATKRWAKKVRGKLHYFGPWHDPQAALEKWLSQKDDLLAGRKPRTAANNKVSVFDACNLYLDHLQEMVDDGTRSEHWYQDCRHTCRQITETIGKNWAMDSLTREDFKDLAKRFQQKRNGGRAAPVTVRGHVHRTKTLFNWLAGEGLIDAIPAYGSAFKSPSDAEVANARFSKDAKLFTRRQVRALLKASKESPRIHAAILLGINTGCQNIDVETLEHRHIDWKAGWYNQPRRKRAKPRRAKLWKRTVRALKRQMEGRQLTPESLVFQSDNGLEYHGRNVLSKEFRKLRDGAGQFPEGSGFQWLRHTFITIASQSGDRESVKIAVGHADRDITANYIHTVSDPRQIAISQHVENWLVRAKK